MIILSVFPEVRAKLWKTVVSRNVEKLFLKILDPYLQTDDLQNLTSSSSSNDASLVIFERRSNQ